MKCVHENSKSCEKDNPAVGLLAMAVANMSVHAVYDKCPGVVMRPCKEPDQCGIEDAGMCMKKFVKHFNNTEINAGELCL